MSLECLRDFIGLEGCTPTTPESGLFINQLPGVELKMLDKIADEQQLTAQGVYTDVQERGLRRLERDIETVFKRSRSESNYRLKSITQSVDIGRIIDTTTTTATSLSYRGYTLELLRETESFSGSNLQAINVATVEIFSDFAGAVRVRIFDADQSTELFNTEATFVTGWNTVTVGETYLVKRIFVNYDTTNITSVTQNINKLRSAVDPCIGCSTNRFAFHAHDCNVEIRGASILIADVVENAPLALTYGDDTFGTGGVFSICCSFQNLICNNKKVFTEALWYVLGIELMKERLYSSRINEFTVFDREKAQELHDMFEIMYRGGEVNGIDYDGYLNQAVEGINLNPSDCCLECNNEVRFMTSIP